MRHSTKQAKNNVKEILSAVADLEIGGPGPHILVGVASFNVLLKFLERDLKCA